MHCVKRDRNGKKQQAQNGPKRITGKDENVRVIEDALETALREKPLWFFTNIIMPLLPRETRAAVEAGDKVVEWRGLMGVVAGEGDGEKR
jgi:hypothetical protein